MLSIGLITLFDHKETKTDKKKKTGFFFLTKNPNLCKLNIHLIRYTNQITRYDSEQSFCIEKKATTTITNKQTIHYTLNVFRTRHSMLLIQGIFA
jgi:hypothetical protein